MKLVWVGLLNSQKILITQNLQEAKEVGIKRKLVDLVNRQRYPRKEYVILDKEDNVIGQVTLGTQSPSLQKAIGMGYVKKSLLKRVQKFSFKCVKNP